MLSPLLLSLAIAAQTVVGTPIRARTSYSVKETHNAPRAWSIVERAPAAHMLHLQIGLKQERFDELERHLYEVSDPAHERYGAHLTAEEVQDLVKPTEENLDFVHEWLLTNGVDKLDYSPAKDWINVYISVEAAERLLDTEYSVYEHEDDSSQVIRTSKWSLPDHLHEVIDTIQPTTSFFKTKPQSTDYIQFDEPYTPPNYQPPSSETIAKVCNFSSVTIECFQNLYGTLGYEQKAGGVNKIAFNNYLNQTPVRPDVYKFLQIFRPEAADEAFSFKSIEIAGGPTAQFEPLTPEQSRSDHYSEALLDVQTIIGMAYPAPVYSYSTGGSPAYNPDLTTPTDTNEPYLVWVNWISKQTDIPQVISSSYGDDEQTVPKGYARRVCHEFAQLGARGVSLLVSSGDGGAGGSNPTACVTNDGKNTTTFLPTFPASCPYVTVVGATMQFEPEVSAYRPGRPRPDGSPPGLYASGSGFSSYFHRPKYQDDVVPAYVKSLNGKWAGLFDKSGRGYPDVSVQGLSFAFIYSQTQGTISGTSASCPLMSSIISLVNDALISDGKPPLGFLNPWLYSKGYQGFTDIVSGDSYGCGGTGFPTAVGWDAVTGFGTPVFPKLLELVK